ncbi:fungal-specific transcription factor domain-containing protein [Pholiota molesta]|nr:fungal-specific transcription factor domain-containing protein [Pholiota molesta]
MSSGGKGKEPKQKKKPGRVPTACAECRRLKLRCDRNVPCEKCVQRGCGSICPTGELVTGKNNKMILANTEELHDRIDAVSARNRELENALRTLQESLSDQPHPLLLEKDVLNLRINTTPLGTSSSTSSGASTSSSSKSPSASRISPAVQPSAASQVKLEEEHNVLDAFGTLVVGRREESRHLGKTARSEYLAQATTRSTRPPKHRLPRLSNRLVDVSLPDSPIRDDDLLSELLDLLPQQSKAQHLCDLYLEYGKYLYSPISRKELLDGVLAVVYKAKQYTGFDHYHSLSLLYVVFAIAELFNPEAQAYTPEAHEYYHLSRVALQFSPPTYDTTLSSIQTLIHMAQYLDLSGSDPSSAETAWMHSGHAMRLAQSVGLHLNSGRWKMNDDALQRRHALFWRLFVVDTYASTHLGRPSSILQSHIDIPLPPNPTVLSESGADAATIFHAWNVHFTFLLHSITELALGPKQPVYSVIIDCDRKIRDFEVPVQWRIAADDDSLPLDVAMYRWLVISAKETALLNLHRGYVAQALQEAPGDLQRHRYLPSVVAVYRSAWRLIRGLATTWTIIPKFLARVSLAWSHGLSAAIVMCLLVTRAPTSHLTSAALDELENLTSLFDSSSSSCRSAAKFLTSVQNLQRKAHEATGLPPNRFHMYADESSSNISLPELDRLNGKTHIFYPDQRLSSSTAGFSSGAASSSASTLHDASRSRATSVTISDIAEGSGSNALTSPLFHSTDNLHATLVQDLRDFSLGTVPRAVDLALFDYPSPSVRAASDDVDMAMSMSPPPRTSQETARAKEPSPPETARVPSQSQPHGHPRQPPPPQHQSHSPLSPAPAAALVPAAPPTSAHTHYFHTALQQQHDPHPLTLFSEPRRTAALPLNYFGAGSGSGMSSSPSGGGWSTAGGAYTSVTFPPGFQAGWGSGFGHSPIALDSSWNSFVEQLGF